MTTTPENASADEPADRGRDDDEPGYITDDQLPQDVRPDEDNPLALDPDEQNGDSTTSSDEAASGDGPDSSQRTP